MKTSTAQKNDYNFDRFFILICNFTFTLKEEHGIRMCVEKHYGAKVKLSNRIKDKIT